MKKRESNYYILSTFMKEKIDVFFDSIKFGTLKVEFEPNLGKLKREFKNVFNLVLFVSDFLNNLGDSIYSFINRIEEETKLSFEKYQSVTPRELFYSNFVERCGIRLESVDYELYKCLFNAFINANEEKFFDLLESLGPKFLANVVVQNKLKKWMEEEEGNKKITKIGNALKAYYLKKFGEPKKGRSVEDILKATPKEKIKKLYRCLLHELKYIKGKKEHFSVEFKMLEASSVKYVINDIKDTINRMSANINKKKQAEFRKRRQRDQEECFEIIYFINQDGWYKKEFYEWKWAPYEMAVKVLSRFFKVSEQSIIDIVHRKGKPTD